MNLDKCYWLSKLILRIFIFIVKTSKAIVQNCLQTSVRTWVKVKRNAGRALEVNLHKRVVEVSVSKKKNQEPYSTFSN